MYILRIPAATTAVVLATLLTQMCCRAHDALTTSLMYALMPGQSEAEAATKNSSDEECGDGGVIDVQKDFGVVQEDTGVKGEVGGERSTEHEPPTHDRLLSRLGRGFLRCRALLTPAVGMSRTRIRLRDPPRLLSSEGFHLSHATS